MIPPAVMRQSAKTLRIAHANASVAPSARLVSSARRAIAPLIPALATLANQALRVEPSPARDERQLDVRGVGARARLRGAAGARGYDAVHDLVHAAVAADDHEELTTL